MIKKGFILSIETSQETKNSIKRLSEIELALSDVNKELREAKKTGDTDAYAKAKTSQIALRDEATKTRKAIKETNKELNKDKFPKDSIVGLEKAYSDARKELRGLSKEDPRFDALAQKAKGLKSEIREMSESFGDTSLSIGNYKEAIDKALLGQGSLLGNIKAVTAGAGGSSAALTGLVAAVGPLAIGGAVAAGVVALGNYVGDLTAQFAELRNETELLTGQTGDALDDTAVRVQAVSQTFDKDYNEVLQSANALSKQLGIDFVESLDFIEKGLLGGVDANGEFLDSVKEYPTFIKEAGLGTEEFLNILALSTQQGIFSDKGIDAVKEATIRLRELPNSTKDALKGIGISLDDITKTIDDDGIGGAIKLVSERLGTLEADSPAVGAALADIFGGAGEDAGLEFIQSLKGIDSETDSLINTSSAYAQQQQRTLEVNERFASVQNDLTKSLGDFKQDISNAGTELQTRFLRYLNEFIEIGAELNNEIISPIIGLFGDLYESLGLVSDEGDAFLTVVRFIADALKIAIQVVGVFVDIIEFLIGKLTDALSPIGDFARGIRDTLGSIDQIVPFLKEYVGLVKEVGATNELTGKTIEQTSSLYKGLGFAANAMKAEILESIEASKNEAAQNEVSIASLKERKKELEAQRETVALNSDEYKRLTEELRKVDAQLDGTKLKERKKDIDNVTESLAAFNRRIDEQTEEELDAEITAVYLQELDNVIQAEQRAKDERIRIANELQDAQESILDTIEERRANRPELPPDPLTDGVVLGQILENERDALKEVVALRDDDLIDFEEYSKRKAEILLSGQIKRLELELQLETTVGNKRLKKQAELDEKLLQQRKTAADAENALDAEAIEKRKALITESLQAISSIASGLNNLQNVQSDEQLKALDEEYARRIELAEGNTAEQERLQEELDDKREVIEREAFERNKRFAIATALINGALAVTKILAETPKFDFGIATAIQIGLAGITTGLQVAAIQAQQFAEGGAIPISDGLLTGPSHTNGGILIEAEGGEGIMKKAAMQSNKKFIVAGTPREMMSQISQAYGGSDFGIRPSASQVLDAQVAGLRPNPVAFLQSQVNLSDAQIDRLADAVAGKMEGLGNKLDSIPQAVAESNERGIIRAEIEKERRNSRTKKLNR